VALFFHEYQSNLETDKGNRRGPSFIAPCARASARLAGLSLSSDASRLVSTRFAQLSGQYLWF
jgi:hypothetical protein